MGKSGLRRYFDCRKPPVALSARRQKARLLPASDIAFVAGRKRVRRMRLTYCGLPKQCPWATSGLPKQCLLAMDYAIRVSTDCQEYSLRSLSSRMPVA
jgi:hypothetical protein